MNLIHRTRSVMLLRLAFLGMGFLISSLSFILILKWLEVWRSALDNPGLIYDTQPHWLLLLRQFVNIAPLLFGVALVVTRLRLGKQVRWISYFVGIITPYVVLLGLFLLSIVTNNDLASFRHPSDKTVISQFNAHRQSYEMLAAMFQQDDFLNRVSTESFDIDYRHTDMQLSSSRFDTYKSLLRSIGQKEISCSADRSHLWFPITHSILIISPSWKGLVYTTNDFSGYDVPSTDGFRSDRSKGDSAYRHITGYWYVYFWQMGELD